MCYYVGLQAAQSCSSMVTYGSEPTSPCHFNIQAKWLRADKLSATTRNKVMQNVDTRVNITSAKWFNFAASNVSKFYIEYRTKVYNVNYNKRKIYEQKRYGILTNGINFQVVLFK